MNDGYPPWHLKEQESAGSGIISSDLCSEGRFQAVDQEEEEKMWQCSYERTQKLLFMEGELTIFHGESSRKERTFLITLKILIWVVIKLSEAENRTFIRKEKARTFQTSHKVPSYRDGGVIGASFVLRHLNKHTLEIQARCIKCHWKAHTKRIWQNPSNLLVCQNKVQLLNGEKCKVPFKAVKLGQWYGSLGKGISCYTQWPEFHPQVPRGGKRFNSFRFFADLHMLTMARVHTSPVDTH